MSNAISNTEGLLEIDEIFASIQGESTDMGLPCLFIRLYGCNIGCNYCDQPQTKRARGGILSIKSLINRVKKSRLKYVCITGGEPLLQWENLYPVILELVSMDIKVSIETSGCVPIEEDMYNRSFKYVMDIKCPSSGVSDKNIFENLMKLQAKDEVKFVISGRTDYDFMKKILRRYPTQAKILVSPCFDKNNKAKIGKELVEWLLKDGLQNVRVQIQMHKVLGVL